MQPHADLDSSSALVIAPPSMLAERSRLGYTRAAVSSPVCIAAAVILGAAGAGIAGLATAAVVAGLTIVACVLATRYQIIRRALDHQERLRERARRERRRLARLRPAGVPRQHQYAELRDLVEAVERFDLGEAARFELQDLLEHFVQLALDQHRCLEALRLAGGERPQALTASDASRSRRRRDISARRARHREDLLVRVGRIADELEAVDELVRLIAQRTACPPSEPELDRELDRRLWELDEVDTALRQLSA